jgi:hypothetical protein
MTRDQWTLMLGTLDLIESALRRGRPGDALHWVRGLRIELKALEPGPFASAASAFEQRFDAMARRIGEVDAEMDGKETAD